MSYEIIVIGTSLGGFQALRIILKELPKDFLLPIVIVQHRDKNSSEPLSVYLQNYCDLEVIEVCDKDEILPGHVYVAPANYHLLIDKGFFSLSTDGPVCYSRPSIDVMFESAAFAYRNKAIGIILTGANLDGTKGLKEIKKYGGFTVAQDPKTAECSVMPESAIFSGVIDKVVSLESMSRFLSDVCCKK